MDRRLFLTGLLGVASCAALAGPADALAGVPAPRRGILDELDEPADSDVLGGDETQADVEPVSHRSWHGRRRRRRRRAWRRVCRRHWYRGRRVTRCRRSRVRISIGF